MTRINTTAREAALRVLNQFQPKPTSLISYQSRGRVLVIGDDTALAICRRWQSLPQLTLISTSLATAAEPVNGTIHLGHRKISIQGHLGAFTLILSSPQGEEETLHADSVLDLSPEAVLNRALLPPGYFHSHIDLSNQHELEAKMADQTGEFEKPRYFHYDPAICAHAVNGKTVCTKCIDACPADAIQSTIEAIVVDAFLCQGGGGCTTACPSGAIQYAYPELSDSGNQLRQMLRTFHQQKGEGAILLCHTEQFSPQNLMQKQDSLLPFQVEELASIGMELCLSALAYGATQIILIADETIPEVSLDLLNRQLDWLQILLRDIGMNPQQISIQASTAELIVLDTPTTVKAATHRMATAKRSAFYQALDHLVSQLSKADGESNLPTGAPFGSLHIDAEKCTLCMACVGACPGKALQDGSNRALPELFFIESHCLQCGACTQTCPEDAIRLSPRLLLDRTRRNRARALNRDQPFACIACGKAFAPTSIIAKMQDRLKHHSLFKTARALDRLKMCENCRLADIVQDPDAEMVNFDSPD